MKKIGKSDVIGQQGMSLIEGIILSMGFMFYPTGGVEAGIDGFIELRDAETGEVGNLLLQVQGKATERERLQGENEETFEFPCADADIEYWTKGTAPVLLIVVALRTRKAYWKSLKEWFADPERRKSRKVVFDKRKDEFTREAKASLISVATAVRPGASGPSVKKSEQILVNLLEVKFAPRVFWAPTSHGSDKSFGGALGEIVKPARGEWIVRSKSVLSFHPLDEHPWKKLCDWEAMEEFDTTEWANSDDEDRQRDFVALLNRAIGEFVRPDLYRDRDSRVFFFRKPKDKHSLNYAYRSLQNTTTRRVVGPYGKKKSDPKKFAYWRHSAFLHRFVRLAGKWYAEITPTYHFTYNGQDADAYAGERLKKIKEIENNAAVMGQFVMWRDFLTTHGAEDLLTKAYPFLSFSAVDALELDVGVPDDLWKSQETDPSSPLFEYALAGETVENIT